MFINWEGLHGIDNTDNASLPGDTALSMGATKGNVGENGKGTVLDSMMRVMRLHDEKNYIESAVIHDAFAHGISDGKGSQTGETPGDN